MKKGDKQIAEIIKRLREEYTNPKTALNYTTTFELLAATVLSAQTTDKQVNRVTASLFHKYCTVADYAGAPVEQLQDDVKSVNYFRTKAKRIQDAARTIIKEFGSQVPKTMAELTRLPGVGRKTANIVLSSGFGVNEGIAVDTHVKRLAVRLGLSRQRNPVKIEQDLMAATPHNEWANLSHLLIFHGRKICTAKRPRHWECVLYDICPSRNILSKEPVAK